MDARNPETRQPPYAPVGERIIVVCGLTRCGSSLTMQMLAAAGIGMAPDAHAPAYQSGLGVGDQSVACWGCMRGKAVKVLDPCRWPPPRQYAYDFVVLSRSPMQQALSQAKFLRMTTGLDMPAPINARSIPQDYRLMIDLLGTYPDRTIHRLAFEQLVVGHPAAVGGLRDALGLGPGAARRMAACVRPRPSGVNCAKGLGLELELLQEAER